MREEKGEGRKREDRGKKRGKGSRERLGRKNSKQ